MKDYTVLLLRPEYIADAFGQDTYMTHVEAGGVREAQHKAQLEAIHEDFDSEEIEPTGQEADYAILMVIEGHHMDLKKV